MVALDLDGALLARAARATEAFRVGRDGRRWIASGAIDAVARAV